MLKKLACTANRLAIPRILQEYRPRIDYFQAVVYIFFVLFQFQKSEALLLVQVSFLAWLVKRQRL